LWFSALRNIGLVTGEDYDVYRVNGPTNTRGNGIGGRATSGLLAGYDNILYTSGDLATKTLANGDSEFDPSDDVGTLSGWLDLGGKGLFLTGDGLASDLDQSGTETREFLQNYMGLALVAEDIVPLIGNQTSPRVRVTENNPVFDSGLETWVAFGGCEVINSFDAVERAGTGQRIAEFLDPAGQAGQYSYSVANLNILNPGPNQSRVISMPVDLAYVYTNPGEPGNPLPARARLLQDVLEYFGVPGGGEPSSVEDLPGLVFEATLHPNPFNPVTTITYSLPRTGHLKLSIYSVRGQLIKTLIDGPRPAGAGQTVVWDGTDNLGAFAASGVYFFEASAAGEVHVGKMTLLK
jgi:hypothetical protein